MWAENHTPSKTSLILICPKNVCSCFLRPQHYPSHREMSHNTGHRKVNHPRMCNISTGYSCPCCLDDQSPQIAIASMKRFEGPICRHNYISWGSISVGKLKISMSYPLSTLLTYVAVKIIMFLSRKRCNGRNRCLLHSIWRATRRACRLFIKTMFDPRLRQCTEQILWRHFPWHWSHRRRSSLSLAWNKINADNRACVVQGPY